MRKHRSSRAPAHRLESRQNNPGANLAAAASSPTADPCRPLGMCAPLPPPPPARPARYDFLSSKPPPNYVCCLSRPRRHRLHHPLRHRAGPRGAIPARPLRRRLPAAGRGRGKAPGEDDGGDEEKGYDENRGQLRRALLQRRLRRGYNDSVAVRSAPRTRMFGLRRAVWLVQMRQKLSLRGCDVNSKLCEALLAGSKIRD